MTEGTPSPEERNPAARVAARAPRRGFRGRGSHAAAVNALGQRIVSGGLVSGQLIDLPRLENELRFGRTALSEALKVLASKGLVDALQGTGTFVTERSAWNLLDPDLLRWHYETQPKQRFLDSLAEFRLAIEPTAAGYAAERRSDADVGRMEIALTAMERSVGDAENFTEADRSFHAAMLDACGNEFFSQLEPIIEAALFTWIHSVRSTERWRREALSGHRLVLDAIRAGDNELATATTRSLLALARKQEPAAKMTHPHQVGPTKA